MITKRQMMEDIKYLRDVAFEDYVVDVDWLVNDAYEGLVTGELSIEDFLRDAILDIFSEAKCELGDDSRLAEIVERYDIDCK